ncbi:hypothetical protein A2961_03890 [Candidatus Woesebacteria bacterium RIFCSPLOWO2_01_FULL_39_21]|uniref:Major facilitator superfamily (MFS) profile domain-containing protein n=1 Tax=Candidatus Woesebacteria bacterium RIFCSPLOWO2_01_FULL_39_21 TaxID=1802519 RepID=A0A1F8BBZ4_9BACT|nr:MAG: hypothetical protein A2691_04020 [Candidatus Woesebacteria bacterium RIFCSPHIGHO2_01_FULL_39_23]OGM61577.1 MAG: hypothetical protein A2961_03890 [Candidatus Woesebacteria bacterium RIFCSPLOWO2_01_FULL_39_21]
MREFVSTIKSRHFTYLWFSQIISQLIINTLSFLIITRIFELTNSTIAVSFVWVAYAMPAIVFGPIGAVTADIVDKRKIMILSLAFQSLVIFSFSFFYYKYLFLSYAVVFTYSLFNQFYMPSEAATLPHIVHKKRLPQANSLFFITVQSGLVSGFVLAGFLYNFVGFKVTTIAASVVLATAALSVSLLPTLKSHEKLPRDFEKGVGKFFSDMLEGYSFIKNNTKILFPFLILIGLQVTLSIVVVSLPAIVSQVVKTEVSLAGLIVVVPGAVGALSSTFIVARLMERRVRKRKLIWYSLLILSICLLIISTIVPNVYFWLGRLIAILCFFLAGGAYVVGIIPSLTFLQEVTPQDLMGRVFGNIWFVTTVATLLPVLFSATITEIFGIKLLLFILGIGGILVSLWFKKRQKYLII